MPGAFELKRAADTQFMFNLKAGNGEIILTSGMFDTKAAASAGIALVRTNAAHDAQFERKIATSKEPYFLLKSTNDDVIGRSEMYSSQRRDGERDQVRRAHGA